MELDSAQTIVCALASARTLPQACDLAVDSAVRALGAKAARVRLDGDVLVVSAGDPEAVVALGDGARARTFPLETGTGALGELILLPDPQRPLTTPLARMIAASLAQAVERLNRQASGARLERTEEELLQALRHRDEFLSVASHELSTPLTSLQLNLEQLSRRLSRTEPLEPQKLLTQVAGMARQVKRLGRLLGHLLDLSRIRNQRFHLDLEAFDLCELVRELHARFSGLAQEHGCELRVRCEGRIIGYWDRMRLEQVLSNLTSNALKYGDCKPVELHVERHGDDALVSVTDNGIGIPVEDVERIFDRFERATSRHQSESFGLGLFISREIARAHGGTVEVSSVKGRGSTFILRLPIHRLNVQQAEAAKS